MCVCLPLWSLIISLLVIYLCRFFYSYSGLTATMSVAHTMTMPLSAPPPTVNTLDRKERYRLVRSTQKLGAVLGNTCSLAGDLGGVDEVLEDLLVDGGEGSGSGSLLLRGGSRVSLRLGEDSSLRQEDDVFVGQLLLELSGEPVG